MIFQGKAWKFGDDIDTDAIIPEHYMFPQDEERSFQHCLAGIDPDFTKSVQPGDILVVGENFGCGSAREFAPRVVKGCGLSCVVAASFARTFLRNAINIGLPVFECPEAATAIRQGHEVEVDADTCRITNVTTGATYPATPFPEFLREIIAAGGLINYAQKTLGLGQGVKEKDMAKEIIRPAKLHRTVSYNPAIKVGNTVYISGQVALDAQGNTVGKGDFRAQAAQTFENLKMVVEAAGGNLKDVVKLTNFLVRAEDYPTFREIRGQYFPEPWPASTAVIVTALASADWLLEVEAIAVVIE